MESTRIKSNKNETANNAQNTEQESLLEVIPITRTREDVVVNVGALGNKNGSPKKKLYNFAKLISLSDVSLVDYTKGSTEGADELQPLNTLFSDNIVVFLPIPDKFVKESFPSIPIEDVTEGQVKKAVGKRLLAMLTEKVKMAFSTYTKIDVNKPQIKPVGVKDIIKSKNKYAYKGTRFIQLLKVSFAIVKYEDVINFVCDEETIKKFKEDIYIHDIDFTQDFKGVFNEKAVIDYLTIEHNFNIEGEIGTEGHPTIKKNDKQVGTNCLTFIATVGDRKVRYKLYNKFVQSMESPSVRGDIGSHIKDWVQNPEPILEEAIKKSLDTGLLRLEITFYLYEDEDLPTEDYYKENMSWLKHLFNNKGDIIRYNPIQTQFNLLCECVPLNLCLVDITNKLAFISLFFNNISGKTNGFYIEELTQTKLTNALKYYCSNNPIYVVLLDYKGNNNVSTSKKDEEEEEEDEEEDEDKDDLVRIQQDNKEDDLLRIQQDVYIRMATKGNPLYTCLPRGSENLQACSVKPNTPQPKDVGLAANSTFNFIIPTRKSNLLLKTTALNRTDIAFKPASYPLLNYPDKNTTLRSINKQLKEDVEQQKFDEKNKEKIDAITIANKQLESDRLQAQVYENVKHKILDLYKSTKQATRRFVDLDNGTVKYCFAFKPTQTRYGNSYLLACADVETIKEDTVLELFWATTTITPYLDKYTAYCPKIDNSIPLYGTTIGKYLITFRKDGEYYSQSRNKCASIKILKMAKPDTIKRFKEEEKDVEVHIRKNKPLEELPPTVKATNCFAIDDYVEEGEVVQITGYRQLAKQILVEVDGCNYYRATYWLKELIEDRLSENKLERFKVIAGKYKTTPQKSKCRLYKDGRYILSAEEGC